MASRVPITIRVDRFEGPLDLLLYLIQSHELDVSQISIARITDQYLAYVRLMQELNFDIASDFLLMAATLIQWKSKSLLPVEVDPNAMLDAEGDDVLSPEDLLRQLQEHQRFLAAGRELDRLPLLGDEVYVRPNHRKPIEKIWKLMDVTGLALTYQDLLVKERKRTTILKKETVSLAEKILDFGDRMEVGKLTGLRALLRDPTSNPETVVSFLATLELGRLKKMKLYQEGTYEEIYVELLESIKGFDTALASGFDSIEAAIAKDLSDRNEKRESDRIHEADRLAGLTAGIGAESESSADNTNGDASETFGAPGDSTEGGDTAGDYTEILLAAEFGTEDGPGARNSAEVEHATELGTENRPGLGNPSDHGLAGRHSGVDHG
ncbi:MAG: segregation/condensation protein A [Cryobacterium sp.]|nr:segregation/condensation protein A [Oligoflexia bacterium]